MLKRTTIAMIFATGLLIAGSTSAQTPCDLYQHSLVIRSGNQIIGPKPPYFALHPPVYYDRIVPRAYGISPFAVPAGVMPVENQVPVAPKAISNPFYPKEESAPTEDPAELPAEKTTAGDSINFGKTQAKFIKNRFYLEKVVAKD